MYQREISAAADAAVLAYNASTPPELRTALGVYKAMTGAEAAMVKSLQSKSFEKYVPVAHKDNGDAFFNEVLSLPSFLFKFCCMNLVNDYLCNGFF